MGGLAEIRAPGDNVTEPARDPGPEPPDCTAWGFLTLTDCVQ